MRTVLALCLLAATACSESDPEVVCSLDEAADLGTVTASYAQRCNVSGSMGQRKWYRLAATVPGTDDVVQLELYDQAGAFAGSAVQAGTFAIEPDLGSCGVCLRALGAKGTAEETEYVATAGSVTITALGATGEPVSATITDVTFEDVASGTCTTSLARIQIDGTLEAKDEGGGGGGGGGGGSGGCSTTIGD